MKLGKAKGEKGEGEGDVLPEQALCENAAFSDHLKELLGMWVNGCEWRCRCCLEGAFPVSLSTTVRPWGSQGGGEPGGPGWCWGPEQSLPEGLRRTPGLRPDSPLPLAHRQFEASGHLWTLSLNTWLQCASPPSRATPPREPGVSSLAPSSCQRLPQTSTVPGPLSDLGRPPGCWPACPSSHLRPHPQVFFLLSNPDLPSRNCSPPPDTSDAPSPALLSPFPAVPSLVLFIACVFPAPVEHKRPEDRVVGPSGSRVLPVPRTMAGTHFEGRDSVFPAPPRRG